MLLKMFFWISLGFVATRFPDGIVSFLFIFNKVHQNMAPWGFVFPALLAKSSHVYNLFIYFYFDNNFQKAFCQLFCNCLLGQEETGADIGFISEDENPRPTDIQLEDRSSVFQDRSKGGNRAEDGAEEEEEEKGGSSSHRAIKPVHTCWVFTLDNTEVVSENEPAQVTTSFWALSHKKEYVTMKHTFVRFSVIFFCFGDACQEAEPLSLVFFFFLIFNAGWRWFAQVAL